jgi:hypothetical protein
VTKAAKTLKVMPPANKTPHQATTLATMGVDRIFQYDGKDMVDMSVEIDVPGSWFGGTAAGRLTATERKEMYKAQAVEFAAVREFPASASGSKKSREAAIRFICIEDAADDPHSNGYWMKLAQWNRYLFYTYKDKPETEHPFHAAKEAIPEEPLKKEPTVATARIKTVFEAKGEGKHVQSDGSEVSCSWWKCTQPGCKLVAGHLIREVPKSASGQMFRHLKTCNPALWRELRLESKHSKVEKGENGEDIEVSAEHMHVASVVAPCSPPLLPSPGRSSGPLINPCPRTCALSNIASLTGKSSTVRGLSHSKFFASSSTHVQDCPTALLASRSLASSARWFRQSSNVL